MLSQQRPAIMPKLTEDVKKRHNFYINLSIKIQYKLEFIKLKI